MCVFFRFTSKNHKKPLKKPSDHQMIPIRMKQTVVVF